MRDNQSVLTNVYDPETQVTRAAEQDSGQHVKAGPHYRGPLELLDEGSEPYPSQEYDDAAYALNHPENAI